MVEGVPGTKRRTPRRIGNMVGPGVVTHANPVNGLRVKQLQKAPLNANGFLSKCQNWSDRFFGERWAGGSEWQQTEAMGSDDLSRRRKKGRAQGGRLRLGRRANESGSGG